jgi:hypothetical protein
MVLSNEACSSPAPCSAALPVASCWRAWDVHDFFTLARIVLSLPFKVCSSPECRLMGISTSVGMLLLRARLHGARFTRVVTIGRQSLTIPKRDLKAMARKLGIHDIDWKTFASNGFAEEFFRYFLASESVQSIDYSDYEKVDIVHDLNIQIFSELNGAFDALVDGGDLEHIFDVKQVLINYMNMVKVGGSLFVITTANNLCGHGFYQFSPAFFYRVFDQANGFIVNDAILIECPLLSVETSRRQRCFRVVDPAEVGRRVELINDKPVLIFIHATRISNETPFRETPIQSDYREKWQSAAAIDSTEKIIQPFAYLNIWREFLCKLKQRKKNCLTNDDFFQPLGPLI